MSNSRWIVGLIATAALGACGLLSGTRDTNFRVEVLAGDTVLGSGVMRVSARRTPSPFESAAKLNIGFTAEAVPIRSNAVDNVFMTLKPSGQTSSALFAGPAIDAMSGEGRTGGHQAFWKALGEVAGAWGTKTGDIDRYDWPHFVAFTDPADPASVREVDPKQLGVTAIRITTTDEPVSDGLRQYLPWLTDGGGLLQPMEPVRLATEITFAETLTHNEFRQGFRSPK